LNLLISKSVVRTNAIAPAWPNILQSPCARSIAAAGLAHSIGSPAAMSPSTKSKGNATKNEISAIGHRVALQGRPDGHSYPVIPASPMRVFPIWIKHPFHMTVQCAHHADVRKHRWPVTFCHNYERFHRGLPFEGFILCLRQCGDVQRGIAKRDQLFALRQRNRIVKLLIPRHNSTPRPRTECSIGSRKFQPSPYYYRMRKVKFVDSQSIALQMALPGVTLTPEQQNPGSSKAGWWTIMCASKSRSAMTEAGASRFTRGVTRSAWTFSARLMRPNMPRITVGPPVRRSRQS
jgi:hypothetical protein